MRTDPRMPGPKPGMNAQQCRVIKLFQEKPVVQLKGIQHLYVVVRWRSDFCTYP